MRYGNAIAELVSTLRTERDWTLTELGQQLEPPVTNTAVHNWEAGKTLPTLDNLKTLTELADEDFSRARRWLSHAREERKASRVVDDKQVDFDRFDPDVTEEVQIGDYRVALMEDGRLLVNKRIWISLA